LEDIWREAEARLRIPGARLSFNELLSCEENRESKADYPVLRYHSNQNFVFAAQQASSNSKIDATSSGQANLTP